MPTCHDVALRITRGDVDTLSFYKRIMLHLHLSMCKVCGPFERQIKLLSDAFRVKWGKPTDPESVEKLQNKLKEKLLG